MTDVPLSTAKRINDYCHAKGIYFIGAEVRGLFAWAFADFGEAFEIYDQNGEEAAEVLVGHVDKGATTLVTVIENQTHGLETGDVVRFSEIKGMPQLNQGEYKAQGTHSLSLAGSHSLADSHSYAPSSMQSSRPPSSRSNSTPARGPTLRPAAA